MPKFLEVTNKSAARAALGADAVYRPSRVVAGTGIDLTGATASTTAFQAILDAAAADAAAGSGTVEVLIPPGVLLVTTAVTVGKGVTVRGSGRDATTIRGSGAEVLRLTGESDITIADLTVECVTNANSIAILDDYDGLQKRVAITNCRITGATNGASAVRFGARFLAAATAIDNLRFTNNLVENCAAGFLVYSPPVTSGLISTNIVISGNHFRNVGSVNIQIYGPGADGNNPFDSCTVFGVEITGNDLRDFAQTGPGGPIPIEPNQITNLVVAHNVIDGTATRGISMSNNVNSVITSNLVRNQSTYAFELNGGRQMIVANNVAENCTTFAHETSYPDGDSTGRIRLSDVVIANNVYNGSGLSSAVATDVIRLGAGQRVRISDNVINNWQHLRTAFRIGDNAYADPEDCTVDNNTLIVSDANTPIQAVNVRSGIRTNITRNLIRVNRNLAAGDNEVTVLQVVMDADSSDCLVADNHIVFSGTVAAAADASAIGNNVGAAAAACPGLTVRRNHVVDGPRGLYLKTNSTDLVVDDNDTASCAGADIIPSTASRSRRLVRRTIQTITSAVSIPTNAEDRIVIIDSGGVPTLGTAVNADCVIAVKNRTDAGVAIGTTSSQTIEGLSSYTLPAGQSITIVPNSTGNWSIV